MKKLKLTAIVLAFVLLFSACAAGGTAPSSAGIPAPATEEQYPSNDSYYSEPQMLYQNDDWYDEDFSNEDYLAIQENRFFSVAQNAVTTFSLKVDTAAYNNVERYIQNGGLPPVDAVRTEELLNYFSYDQKLNFDGNSPFALYTEVGPSPFDASKQLAFIRVKTREIAKELLPPSNIVFLIDTSGSMAAYDKLPLLQTAFEMFTETLDKDDRVSIVTYAGSSAVVLDSVSGASKDKIIRAINQLSAGGSTAGADGINTAYKLAAQNFIEDGNNRIILATDGDFNVGVSDLGGLQDLITEKRDSGIYLSILGFGTGNLKDSTMETLATHGNGNYSYINSVKAAEKVLVDELAANLFTVANDVKAQLEFNPENVKSYRLIGYENRRMKNEDFENDRKDAGEIGAGSDVVALFEIELANADDSGLKYAQSDARVPADNRYSDELFEVRIRYKDPGSAESKLITRPVKLDDIKTKPTSDFTFASSVAIFGHLLRDSEYLGDATIDDAISMAEDSTGKDANGYRRDYVKLLKDYRRLLG